jgi:hypothetical protein
VVAPGMPLSRIAKMLPITRVILSMTREKTGMMTCVVYCITSHLRESERKEYWTRGEKTLP